MTVTCSPDSEAPHVTHKYAICQVCGVQWAIRSDVETDAQGCSFCDAPANAITVVSEAPDYSGRKLGER